jgi:hypothetical protein
MQETYFANKRNLQRRSLVQKGFLLSPFFAICQIFCTPRLFARYFAHSGYLPDIWQNICQIDRWIGNALDTE